MFKKMISFLLMGCLGLGSLSLAACQPANAAPGGTAAETPADSTAQADNGATEDNTASAAGDAQTENGSEGEGLTMLQLTPLNKGEELVVLHTSMGDIKLRLFPEEAPMAVENFITHAKAGYYDGVTFHRIIKDFMIQGGDPQGTGMGGESIWGGGFASEFSMSLRHFRGALAMAHSSAKDSNGSQFYIVQNSRLDDQFVQYFQELKENQTEVVGETEDGQEILLGDILPTEALDEYLNNGGTPHLDFVFNEDGHTVFGHVVEGMDIVDAMAAVDILDVPQTDSKYGRPVKDIVIESITFEIYQ